jgi:electron transport complex protein RnfD
MAKTADKLKNIVFSPHIHGHFSIENMMWNVVIALIPAGIASFYFFGTNAFLTIGISVGSGLIIELLINLFTRSRITVLDGSVVITSLILAYNLPVGTPWHIIVIGNFFAVAIAKWAFGGLGYNFMNPALGGKIFLLAIWPAVLGQTGNIPLRFLEIQTLAFLLGFIYLIIKKIMSPWLTLAYLGTAVLLAWIFGGVEAYLGFFAGNPLDFIFTGGMVLGACFMATDPVTSPLTQKGKIIYGALLGILTVTIRLTGNYQEGMVYAIVFMNLLVPFIEKVTKKRIFGYPS